jgi:hypothetical protein
MQESTWYVVSPAAGAHDKHERMFLQHCKKPAATPNTLDLLESALDEIASINANDEGT